MRLPDKIMRPVRYFSTVLAAAVGFFGLGWLAGRQARCFWVVLMASAGCVGLVWLVRGCLSN